MTKILGLDIGANSLGWALLNNDNNTIIDMGSHVFPAGVSDFDTAKEKSKMADRRSARSARRRFWRRKRRLRKLRYIFKEYNISNLKVHDYNSLDPYEIRKKALDKKITFDELARAIYHLAKRRGYFDISCADAGEEAIKEKGKIFDGLKEKGEVVIAGINDLRKQLITYGGNFRTVGEYFASVNTDEVRIRCRYTERQMFIDEFEQIWNKQKEYYPDILNDELKEKIKKAAFWQRPLKMQKSLIGYCKFEKLHRRAPKSHPIAQLFRMYQVINNLTISGGNRILDNEKELSELERSKLINKLLISKGIELGKNANKQIVALLKLDKNSHYVTNYDHQGKIDGIKTYSAIFGILKNKSIFNYNFKQITETSLQEKIKINEELKKDFLKDEITIEELLQAIWRIIFTEKRTDIRINNLKRKFDLDDETANKLANIGLEPGYASLSIRAMRKMLPYLRMGYKYDDAACKAGYHHSLWDEEVEKLDYLPPPAFIRNPIVTTSLNELRKLVNELITRYGKPDIIRVELARDLKKSRKERQKIKEQNLKNRAEREEAIKEIKNYFSDSEYYAQDFPRDRYITKYRLWKQQKHLCIYSGQNIGINQLFSAETDIDHILPYSKTLDDSMNNKVVCFRYENAFKANKIPWEAYAQDKAKYHAILDRVKTFPTSKAKKFQMNTKQFKDYIQGKDEEHKDFIERQLNDTRYISKEALKYLKHICDEVNVSTGSTTAYLRKYWGLNTILAPAGEDFKNREDHRHHAIDAVVIALTNRSTLQRLSTYSHITGDYYLEDFEQYNPNQFPLPWENFRKDVQEKVDCIIVSHKVNRRARGKLHDETYFGLRKNHYGQERTDEKGQKLFHVRKPLDSNLTHSQIKSIVEEDIKEAIFQRLLKFGIDPDSKFTLPVDFFNEPLVIHAKNGNSYRTKSVRIAVPSYTMRKIRDYNIWVETGSNHHIIIYKDITIGKQNGKVVTLLDAVQRKRKGLPVIDKELGTNEEFMYSLIKNELVYLGEFPENFDLNNKNYYKVMFDKIYRVQKFDQYGRIILRQHNIAVLESIDKEGKKVEPGILRKSAPSLEATKLKITTLGFLSIAND